MNENVFYFKSTAKIVAEENLINFIQNCKSKLTAFGHDCWDQDKWAADLGTRRVIARFSTNTKSSNSYSYSPLERPFIDFAKAYIRYIYSLNPVTNLQRHIEAIRVLEEALLLSKGSADILLLDGTVLEYLDEVFRARISDPTGRNKAGYQMELILNFCRDNFITPSLPQWSNPYKKIKDLTITLDEKGKEHRSKKLPSDKDMLLIAQLFHDAPSLGIEAEYFSAVMTLLMLAPSRCSELFSLSTECIVWEEDRAGEKKLGIRWIPAKNGKEGIKWVPTVMQDVALEAIARLTRIGEPARHAARQAEYNNSTSKTTEFINSFKCWPYVDSARSVKVSQALLLFRKYEFHKDFSVINGSFCLPTVNLINDRFVQKESRSWSSLWSKYNISKPDGTHIQIPSHNARHWLSTKAERGGMDEQTLAHWAGRARLADNRSYDHRTEEEKASSIIPALLPEMYSVLDKIKQNLPVSYEDIGKNLIGTAIITELGICEHDFAMMPCQLNGDCETCKELVCIKGFSSSLELLKTREKQVSEQLENALKNRNMGMFGADRWVSSHGWRLTHVRTKIRLLEDSSIPDGTPVRIPDEYDPSPAKQVLLDKGMSTEIQTPESIEAKMNEMMRLLACPR